MCYEPTLDIKEENKKKKSWKILITFPYKLKMVPKHIFANVDHVSLGAWQQHILRHNLGITPCRDPTTWSIVWCTRACVCVWHLQYMWGVHFCMRRLKYVCIWAAGKVYMVSVAYGNSNIIHSLCETNDHEHKHVEN